MGKLWLDFIYLFHPPGDITPTPIPPESQPQLQSDHTKMRRFSCVCSAQHSSNSSFQRENVIKYNNLSQELSMSLSYYSSCSKGIWSHNNKMKYTLGFILNMPIICSDICPIYIYFGKCSAACFSFLLLFCLFVKGYEPTLTLGSPLKTGNFSRNVRVRRRIAGMSAAQQHNSLWWLFCVLNIRLWRWRWWGSILLLISHQQAEQNTVA